LYIKLKKRLAEGGFNARKFVSNSKALMERMKENEKHLITADEKKRNSRTTRPVKKKTNRLQKL
jgi:hypothetical protein